MSGVLKLSSFKLLTGTIIMPLTHPCTIDAAWIEEAVSRSMPINISGRLTMVGSA